MYVQVYRSQRYRHDNEGISTVSVLVCMYNTNSKYTMYVTSHVVFMCIVQVLPVLWSSIAVASYWHGVLLHGDATDDDDGLWCWSHDEGIGQLVTSE